MPRHINYRPLLHSLPYYKLDIAIDYTILYYKLDIAVDYTIATYLWRGDLVNSIGCVDTEDMDDHL